MSARLPTETDKTDHDGRSTMLDAATFIRSTDKSKSSSFISKDQTRGGSVRTIPSEFSTPKPNRKVMLDDEKQGFKFRDKSNEN